MKKIDEVTFRLGLRHKGDGVEDAHEYHGTVIDNKGNEHEPYLPDVISRGKKVGRSTRRTHDTIITHDNGKETKIRHGWFGESRIKKPNVQNNHFHNKSDEELLHIIADASDAANRFKDHNPVYAGEKADEANDAQTIMNWRRVTGNLKPLEESYSLQENTRKILGDDTSPYAAFISKQNKYNAAGVLNEIYRPFGGRPNDEKDWTSKDHRDRIKELNRDVGGVVTPHGVVGVHHKEIMRHSDEADRKEAEERIDRRHNPGKYQPRITSEAVFYGNKEEKVHKKGLEALQKNGYTIDDDATNHASSNKAGKYKSYGQTHLHILRHPNGKHLVSYNATSEPDYHNIRIYDGPLEDNELFRGSFDNTDRMINALKSFK